VLPEIHMVLLCTYTAYICGRVIINMPGYTVDHWSLITDRLLDFLFQLPVSSVIYILGKAAVSSIESQH
jgi:hypothetical protein